MFKGLIAVLSLASAQAFALPIPQNYNMIAPRTLTEDFNFAGIVALNNCSGSIIRFERSQMADKAMVLTNGHCLESGMPSPGTFVSNKQSSRQFRVLAPNAQPLGTLTATRIIYSSMTKTDITIYETQETYADIQSKYNTLPLLLASAHPQAGMPIEVISGYWKRGYRCNVEAFIPHLKEGGWMWDDSIRYSRPGCEVIGGTSGSPVVLKGTRTVVAINNTGNDNGQKCTVDNPCEIDKNGNITYQKGLSYAEETYQIYSCISQVNQVELSLPTCQLFGGAGATPAGVFARRLF